MGAVQTAQVKSATRVISILELFDRGRRPYSMTEIALELGYPQSSTAVLLKTLVTLGYLNFDRRDRVYFPTPKVSALGEWVPRALFGSTRVLQAMHDVHAATGEGVGVNAKNDIYVQYLQNLHSTHALRFIIDTGTLRLLTHSGIGWTLMSTLSEREIDNHVRRANIVSEKSLRVDPDFIQRRVEEINAQGYCYVENIPFIGGATLAALLPVRIQNQPVALSLGGALERMRTLRDDYLDILMRAVALSSDGECAPPEESADGA